MNHFSYILLAATLFCPWIAPASAQISVMTNSKPQLVFNGGGRQITFQLCNFGEVPVITDIRIVLSQASSATAVRISGTQWKKLNMLPGQTIVESATLDFPSVKAETRFLIQWVAGASNVVGRMEALVYPTNLLQELRALAGEGENVLGVYDPQNQLKPLFKLLAVVIADLDEVGLEGFCGKLAIVGPFLTRAQMREGLPAQIESVAKRGVRVVWLQPPPEKRDKLQPSFYAVPVAEASVVVAQAELVTNLSENPQSQLNLIHLARLALRPEPPRLPHLSP